MPGIAACSEGREPAGLGAFIPDGVDCPAVDRRLAQKNLRTALIAGAICLFVFAAAWLAAFVY
jgi:hypothetical protein